MTQNMETKTHCPKRRARHNALRKKVARLRISRYLSPKYHVRKLVEDLRSAKAGLKMWQLDRASDEASLRHAIRGKFFATYVVGALFASIGPYIGYAVQVSSGNVILGIYTGVGLANILGLVAFQAVWYVTNKSFYAKRYHGFVKMWNGMLHDLLPMQWKSIQIAVVMNILLFPIAKGVEWMGHMWFPQVLRYVPVSLIVSITEALLIQSTSLRLMGDLFEKHSRLLAKRYAPSLDRVQSASQ